MNALAAAQVRACLDASPLARLVIALLAESPEPVYLVGGSVRDALLGRPMGDLDLAVAGAALPLARRLADRLPGAYVPLDVEHDVARIVVGPALGGSHVDLAGLRGSDILADLGARDFTLNALALPLASAFGPLLDPTGGLADLHDSLLRAPYPCAFEDDPLRVLRGVRLAAQFDLRWSEETKRWARASVPGLRQVSWERIRDEVLRTMGLSAAARAWELGAALDAWSIALPEVAAPEASRAAYERLARLERAFPAGGSPWALLDAFRPRALADWALELSSGRARGQLVRLVAVWTELAPEAVTAVAVRLRLSRAEVQHLAAVVAARRQVIETGPFPPDALAIYRYYRAYGAAGVDGALLAAAGDAALTPCVQVLLEAWWHRRAELVAPPALLDGSQIMRALELAPGPSVGAALERVREAQVQGLVQNAAQALAYLCESPS